MDKIQALLKSGTQYEIAKKVGISQALVSLILKGTRKPGLRTLLKISKAYGVPITDLAGGGLPRKKKQA